MTVDPYVRWRGTPLWRTLARTLLQLQADGQLVFGEEVDSRVTAIGDLCANLDFDGHTAGTRLALIRAAMERAGPDYFIVALEELWSLPFEVCALIDNERDENEIAAYMAKYESEVAGITQRPTHEFVALARLFMAAYERGGQETE
jgi:hypothetical protein